MLSWVVSSRTLNGRWEQEPLVFYCFHLSTATTLLWFKAGLLTLPSFSLLPQPFFDLFFNVSCIMSPSHWATSLTSFPSQGERDSFLAQQTSSVTSPWLKWIWKTLENPQYKCLSSKIVVLLCNSNLQVRSGYYPHPFFLLLLQQILISPMADSQSPWACWHKSQLEKLIKSFSKYHF